MAQFGEVVAQGLLGDLWTARTERAKADLDLSDPQVPMVVTGQVDQELDDDAADVDGRQVTEVERPEQVDPQHGVTCTSGAAAGRGAGATTGWTGAARASMLCTFWSGVGTSAAPVGSDARSRPGHCVGAGVCTRTTTATTTPRTTTASQIGKPCPASVPGSNSKPPLGAAPRPVAGSGAPTQGGRFCTAAGSATGGKLIVVVAAAVTVTPVDAR